MSRQHAGTAWGLDRHGDDWRTQAACREADPELFFPGERDSAYPALAVCRTCPVAQPCLQFALTFEPARDHGVFGGTTPPQRRRLREATC